ncbi:hypothetical protein [Acinetobacter shaoyimingii]|uniref:Uncharacterized protein n=1 Tax=Acinetobacter shaoyimingii TaxID=2715164 RepID=A0A6G8S067_9GAMM|nr:hypothetical protein [Acinetobacter shaoyimingii]NHB57175.1 hypothetical protein [Acinetobacter shaoyimingii]QIO07490.1 hypothetical protein G8E00_09720 [Acinetobacter shaoyimingii]
MEVVAYMHNSDLLLQDEHRVAIINGSHYVLSLGDRVLIKEVIDEKAKIYQVHISFACTDHSMMHEDEIQIRFEGTRESLDEYLTKTTVH